MPSAQRSEIDEPAGRSASKDLQVLLREIHASNIRFLDSVYPRGKVLFAEGEPSRGIYILRSGRAAVSISSSDGRVVIVRMAQPGDVLGLNSALRGAAYDTTVKTFESCRTDFIPRAELIELTETSQAGNHAVVKLLSHELTQLTARMRSVLLSQTAGARLAKLLLEWSEQSQRIERVFTHEEIAQMICSSRETVTRLFTSMSRRKIIRITSDSIVIQDRAALESM